MSSRLALLALACLLALPARAATDAPGEQVITGIEAGTEQRVEALTPEDEQRVEAVDAGDAQQITQGTKDQRYRGLRTAGKIVVGVCAAVFSVGVMMASLLLL